MEAEEVVDDAGDEAPASGSAAEDGDGDSDGVVVVVGAP